ncbi:hypothetical protein [Moorena sp. SIO2C4]|uniref:hypothetical protein n=1 Tax=Moorena sp. SIO2C4 TaxID=2607824 RepID=UPI0013C76C68|nr:hypothetical protein [Moorena sp. SIO2C4]NES43628.1 hypothetical protein [Moorena sp. SIO2C4]
MFSDIEIQVDDCGYMILHFHGSIYGEFLVPLDESDVNMLDKTITDFCQLSTLSYEDFCPLVIDIWHQLNTEYNLDKRVPIYRIRRHIGISCRRQQFNDWLLKMHAEGLIQLQGGSLYSGTDAQIEDSIYTESCGLQFYVKLLD